MTTTTNRTDKVLVVDDDARIRDLLHRYLTQEGFDVMAAEDGKALNRLLLRETVDIFVLDLMMPGEDGLSICRRLRAANDRTPIIMLTAKGEDVDRIVGLEVGADDYLGKPFNPRELLARIHAVLRRRPAQEAPGAPSGDNEVVTFGPFVFDLGTRALQRNGEELVLTTGELAMLKALVPPPPPTPFREKSWPCWRVPAISSRSTAASTCRSRACARWSRQTPPRRAIYRPCGVWATCSCRTEPIDRACPCTWTCTWTYTWAKAGGCR